MILIFMTFSAASQMVGVGNFFGTYLGLNYELAVLAGTGIVLIYSMFGGFRGVVLTDIIQFVLLLISAIAVFLVAMSHSGGFTEIRAAAALAGKQDYMSLTAGASKYATYVITFGCAWMIQANVWQRISAARTTSDARKMAVLSFFAYIPLYLIVVLTGMAGITMFDSLPEGGIVTSIVMNHMSPALGALVFVGISAAIMSTMDSLINTGAIASMAVGLCYCIYNLLISFGVNLPAFWENQSALQVILGVGLSVIIYTTVSLCTRPDYEKADRFISQADLLGNYHRKEGRQS